MRGSADGEEGAGDRSRPDGLAVAEAALAVERWQVRASAQRNLPADLGELARARDPPARRLAATGDYQVQAGGGNSEQGDELVHFSELICWWPSSTRRNHLACQSDQRGCLFGAGSSLRRQPTGCSFARRSPGPRNARAGCAHPQRQPRQSLVPGRIAFTQLRSCLAASVAPPAA
jgi:hypothetical protein